MLKDHKNIEKRTKEAFQAADYKTATSIFLHHYRNDIYTFLLGRLSYNETDAEDVLSEFQEDFCKGLPGFRWRCTLRSWAYRLAWNAACRFLKDPYRKPERHLPLSQQSRIAQTSAGQRSETKKYLRTETKSWLCRIRKQLTDDEQALLVLRVNKKMSWRELAMIMSDGGETLDETDINRTSARLRQRFTKVKTKIKELARDDGMLESTECKERDY